MNICRKSFCFTFAIMLPVVTGFAGPPAVPAEALPGGSSDKKLSEFDADFIWKSVETLAGLVENEYFDPAIAAKVAAALREGLSGGRYGHASTPETLADLLTSDMHAIARDKHLSMSVAKAEPPQQPPASADARESREARGKRDNFGLQRVEILPGNIGYLRITAFYRPEEARKVIAAAMGFLGSAEALILDFRDHGGGSSPTVALFASYFLGTPNMPLFELAPRFPALRVQFRTETENLADRDAHRPTFIVVSPRTCSGGEAIAFLLQERHRAEVVGETTWGGANQVPPPRMVSQCFEAFIPNGRVGSSFSGKNWEGVGVIPDVPTHAENALPVAHARAIRALLRAAPQGSRQETLKRELARAESQIAVEPGAP